MTCLAAYFLRTNALLLRNPSGFNFFDLTALSLPVSRKGALAVGLMLVGRRGHDRELLALDTVIEQQRNKHQEHGKEFKSPRSGTAGRPLAHESAH